MRFRLFPLLALFSLTLIGGQALSVGDLLDFIRSSLAMKYDDAKIAKYVKTVTLKDKLENKDIESLEAQGAGPKTVKALQELQQETANLKSSTPSAPQSGSIMGSGPSVSMSAPHQPPPPDSVRQKDILEAMRAYADSYSHSLPNYLCVQVVERSVSFNGGDSYRHEDRVLSRLSYNNGQETYKVFQVGNQMVDTDLEKLGGAVSRGEFGSLMASIFAPKSEAEFGWDHWGRLRGKVYAVFNYFIDSGHSDFSLDYGRGEQRIYTAYRGKIYADENTGMISRITFEATDIPASFPIREARTTLDFDDQKIGDGTYILPLRALVLMAGPNNIHTKNEERFTLYQKFGTESTIKFSDVDAAPLPAEKTTEQPVEDPLMKGLPPPPPK
jgi:hypothetical protein